VVVVHAAAAAAAARCRHHACCPLVHWYNIVKGRLNPANTVHAVLGAVRTHHRI
jgi:hypothetical protein